MGKRKVGALEKLDADLPSLQHRIRKDPLSYQSNFDDQHSVYVAILELVNQAPLSVPTASIDSFRDLVDFLTQVADCYPKAAANLPSEFATLLRNHHEDLNMDLREKLVGSLALLRKKDLLDSTSLLNVLFPILVTTQSKSLRSLLYQKVISEVRSSNSKTLNHKLNRSLQTALYSLVVADSSSNKSIWAVRITRELWRRQIWTDSKAVEIMKEAALADNVKVILGGVNFFLGGDKEREDLAEESSDDEGGIDMNKLRHQAGINKKTRKKENDLKAAAATVKRKERKKKRPHPLNFSALHLLHDPQDFAEALFSRHLQASKSKLNLEHKLQVLQLVTRLVGLHELSILSLYSYFLKYLTPRQASVTSFLASLSQSVHKHVPPDAIEPLILKIANEFVSEAAAGQVAAAGLNAIREICARQPLAMNDVLLQDLVMYRKSKDKGVMMAAKGLLSLYRKLGPEKLKRKDRGRDATLGLQASAQRERRFGEIEVGGIEGLDLLEKWKEDERRKRRIAKGLPASDVGDEAEYGDGEEDEEENWKAWNVEENDSSSSDGWIDVQSEGDDIDISDSENEQPTIKKVKVAQTTSENRLGHIDPLADPAKEAENFSNLATTKILTPADLAKLNELRLQASISSQLTKSKRNLNTAKSQRHIDDPLTAAEIEGTSALGEKATREDKIASAKADRKEHHQSATARRKEMKQEAGKSTTNKEKARKKNFLMTLGKAKGKQKRSLVETRKVLRGHVERQKRGGRRGNG